MNKICIEIYLSCYLVVTSICYAADIDNEKINKQNQELNTFVKNHMQLTSKMDSQLKSYAETGILNNVYVSKVDRFTVKCPEGWKFDKTWDGGCALVLKKEAEITDKSMYRPFIYFISGNLNNGTEDDIVKDINNEMNDLFVKSWVEIDKVEKGNTLLGNNQAKEITYIGKGVKDVKVNNIEEKDSIIASVDTITIDVKFVAVYLIKGNDVYLARYGGEAESFEKHRKEFDEFLNSFQNIR